MTMYVHTKFQINRSNGLVRVPLTRKCIRTRADADAAARRSLNHSIRWRQCHLNNAQMQLRSVSRRLRFGCGSIQKIYHACRLDFDDMTPWRKFLFPEYPTRVVIREMSLHISDPDLAPECRSQIRIMYQQTVKKSCQIWAIHAKICRSTKIHDDHNMVD